MIIYENQCCDCAVPGYPCLGDSCPRRHVPVRVCDDCEQPSDTLYEYDNQELCHKCLLKSAFIPEATYEDCDNCGEEECALYFLDSEKLCEDCFMGKVMEVQYG